jgi:predicted ATPase/DNA-binding CsgD family transcriptional regulator
MPQSARHDAEGDRGLVAESSGPSDRGRPPDNLPLQLSSFVGREREMAQAEELLSGNRLLTLTGPGGSGKTRLALAVAHEVAETFDDGVWLVELAPLSDPELVPQAVASVLGVRETPGTAPVDSLRAHLGSRRTLLILDNCEHLVAACASLAEVLLRHCPNLRVLATSRETLGVMGETLLVVPPLSLPDPRHPPTVDGLSDYEAARLFTDRARAVRPDFALTQGNAAAVAQICYRLDGIPLAIELAAARARALSAEQISARLENSFRLLTGSGRSTLAHHGTLRATMEWSHDLLGREERILLRRLSTFAGGWTLGAVEAVCAGDGFKGGGILDPLASLVDKSLVLVVEHEGEPRYRLLETLRQYAAEKLEEAGEDAALGRRHAEFFLGLAELAAPELKGHEQVGWLGHLETEHGNLRAAMRWLLWSGEADDAVRLAWALRLFWYVRGHQSEGYRYTTQALQKGDVLPASLRAKALCTAGLMSYGLESIERTRRLWEESAVLFRQTEDKQGLAISLAGIGLMTLQRGDLERAGAHFAEALELYRELGDRWGVSSVLSHLGIISLRRDDQALATRYFEEALGIAREIGDGLIGSIALYNLALEESRVRGDHERAEELFAEGLRLAVEMGDKANAAYCLEGLAGLISTRGGLPRAARLFGASEALLEAVGAPRYAQAQARVLYEGAVQSLRSRLGQDAFEVAWAEGRQMTAEESIAYALERPDPPDQQPFSPTYPADLSAREVDVLRLVAEGMTNADIARELYISPRTVNAHIGSVYNKIGTNTRAEAARFALEHGLL